MALTIQQPTGGAFTIIGAVVATPIPAGVTVTQPTDGQLFILGAIVIGQLVNGAFVQQLP